MSFPHFLAGLKPVYLMTESRNKLTADELSRGKDFWRRQKRQAESLWYRTSGDERLQKILDFQGKCDEAISRCITNCPCSRTVFLPGSI